MTEILLEQPVQLGITIVLVAICTFLVGWISQTTMWKKATFGWLIVGCLLIGINLFVETDHEQLRGFFGKLVVSMEKSGVSGSLKFIEQSYDFEQVNYTMLRKKLKSPWAKWRMANLQFRQWKFRKESGSSYEVKFVCTGKVLYGGFPRPMDKSYWKMHVKKAHGSSKWMISQITPIEFSLPGRASATGLLTLKRLLGIRLR